MQSYETVMLGMADDEANLRKLRVWMVQSLLMCAETDEQSRQPIAAKALTMLIGPNGCTWYNIGPLTVISAHIIWALTSLAG